MLLRRSSSKGRVIWLNLSSSCNTTLKRKPWVRKQWICKNVRYWLCTNYGGALVMPTMQQMSKRTWNCTWKGQQHPITVQGIMSTSEQCCFSRIRAMLFFKNRRMLALVWSCWWWWKEWDKDHDKQGEIFIFDDGYKTVYQCVREVLAWWAINSVIVNVENIMSVIVKKWNHEWNFFFFCVR